MKRLFLFLFVFSATAARAQTLHLSTYQYADNPRVANLEPFARHLEKTCGYTVTVKSYTTVHAFIEGIRNNETDIALINTFGYLLLQAGDKPYDMQAALALAVRPDAHDNYKTIMVAGPRAAGVRTLSDLPALAAALRIAFVAKGSTSGNLVPRLALAGAGVPDPESQFDTVLYAGTHQAALQAVLNGQADLAVFGSTEFDQLKYSDPGKAAGLTQVWLSPEIPLGPVLLHNRLTPAVRQAVINAFLELKQKNEPALEAIKAAWSEAKQATHYVQIGKDHYDSFAGRFGNPRHLAAILKKFL